MSTSSRKHEPPRFAELHVLADDDPRWKFTPLEQAQAACRGGAAVIQLRAKHATDEESVALGLEIRSQTRNAGIEFIFNDRFDLALACGADGVHLGQPTAGGRPREGGAEHSLAFGQQARGQ